jgi:hypothetical protein
MSLVCHGCDAEIHDTTDATLALHHWGWMLDLSGDEPTLFYACPECSDPDDTDAWSHVRVAALRFCEGVPLPDDVTLREVVEALRGLLSWHEHPAEEVGARERARQILSRFGGSNDQR